MVPPDTLFPIRPFGAHWCSSTGVGCQPSRGAFIDLTGLSTGPHTLEIQAYQLWGDAFGVLYEGAIDISVPEGSSLVEAATTSALFLMRLRNLRTSYPDRTRLLLEDFFAGQLEPRVIRGDYVIFNALQAVHTENEWVLQSRVDKPDMGHTLGGVLLQLLDNLGHAVVF
jgi:hypothetical protein